MTRVVGHKLGIIVPYRNRLEHLTTFKSAIVKFLQSKDINYEIIIVEQDNGQLFNRGMLLNIGFTQAVKLGCDYVVFHDVDMLPNYVDYSYSDKPIHLSTHFMVDDKIKPIPFKTYFGGVTLFPVEDFKRINGYSNKYWGWGYEDDDLLLRCRKNDIPLDSMSIKNMGKPQTFLKFNGVDSYVKGKNIINLNSNTTFFASFYPHEIIYDDKKEVDDFSVFSIPGFNTSITYNSFNRYNFCTFDENYNARYVNSDIKTEYKTNMCVTIDWDDKKISVYQDGIIINSIPLFNDLLDYKSEDFFYLGLGNPKDNEVRYFKGYIDKFILFDKSLNETEVFDLSVNDKIPSNVSLHYDANKIESYRLTDLSGNNNDGVIVKCEIVDLSFKPNKEVKIPYRRNCLFDVLPHEDSGFIDNKWKTSFTRWNQLRFQNEVSKNDELSKNDGLSDLKFTLHGKTTEDKITKLTVGL